MEQLQPIVNRDEEMLVTLLKIWESSVQKTHLFLSNDDILQLKPEVVQGLQQIENLFGFYNANGVL